MTAIELLDIALDFIREVVGNDTSETLTYLEEQRKLLKG